VHQRQQQQQQQQQEETAALAALARWRCSARRWATPMAA
jgi:hypothetical protein